MDPSVRKVKTYAVNIEMTYTMVLYSQTSTAIEWLHQDTPFTPNASIAQKTRFPCSTRA